MIGSTVSHYRILEKLGGGGMGVVYKAEDTRLKRTVALKFLPPAFSFDKEAKQRFINEAQSASSLDHNNICTIHEIGETEDGQLFICMNYYEGETLKDKIKRGPVKLDEAVDIITQTANGLEKAHEKGIIHRDIKPANILITNDGVVKLLDFGLAKLSGQSVMTKIGTTVGTIAYMSPEQTKGEEVDQRSDIWSLGVVFYEMLTGELPFKGDYDQAIIYSIINEEPELINKKRKDIPIKIENVCIKALNKIPQKRYNNISELIEELKNSSEAMTISRGNFLPYRRFSYRKRPFIYSLSIIFIVLIGLTLYLLFRNNAAVKQVSVALLPLKNISSESNQDWFTDGMTEALITDLAKISSLRVISRSSVMKFKSTDQTSSQIARALNVSYLIEGSVLRIFNKIKISIRLIDAEKNDYLWAQDYNRNFNDVISLQSEVAKSIAEQIKVKITPYEQDLLTVQHKVNPEAYEAFLKGNFYWYKFDRQSLETALKYYYLSAKIDTQYALAYAGIAQVWVARAQNGYESFQTAYGKGKIAALKALQLDSTLAEVHYMLGNIKAWGDWDWIDAEREFKKSIQFNPNLAEARAFYSHLLYVTKRWEEGTKQIKLAMELDPFNNFYKGFYAMGLMYAHRYDDVIDMLEKLRKTDPGGPLTLSTLKSAYHQKGMYKKAIEIWEAAYEMNNDNEAIKTLKNSYAKGGYSFALKSLAELMIKRSKTKYVTPWQIATLFTRAGMKTEAINWLEKALKAHDPNMPYINVDPIFDYLRNEPGFKAMIKKIGL